MEHYKTWSFLDDFLFFYSLSWEEDQRPRSLSWIYRSNNMEASVVLLSVTPLLVALTDTALCSGGGLIRRPSWPSSTFSNNPFHSLLNDIIANQLHNTGFMMRSKKIEHVTAFHWFFSQRLTHFPWTKAATSLDCCLGAMNTLSVVFMAWI